MGATRNEDLKEGGASLGMAGIDKDKPSGGGISIIASREGDDLNGAAVADLEEESVVHVLSQEGGPWRGFEARARACR